MQEAGCLSIEQNPCIALCAICLSQDSCADLLLTTSFSTEAVTAECKTFLFFRLCGNKYMKKTHNSGPDIMDINCHKSFAGSVPNYMEFTLVQAVQGR